MKIELGTPNIKQERFLLSKKKIIGFGGARGGGKSWAVRFKAKALAAKYSGIKILIVRRTYPELINNHINILRKECLKLAKYNDKDKVLLGFNTKRELYVSLKTEALLILLIVLTIKTLTAYKVKNTMRFSLMKLHSFLNIK